MQTKKPQYISLFAFFFLELFFVAVDPLVEDRIRVSMLLTLPCLIYKIKYFFTSDGREHRGLGPLSIPASMSIPQWRAWYCIDPKPKTRLRPMLVASVRHNHRKPVGSQLGALKRVPNRSKKLCGGSI